MRELAELRVTQIRLYPIDRIPYQVILVARHLSALQEQFHFKSVAPAEEGDRPAVIFAPGDFAYDGKDYLIERLVIQPQKTILTAFAPSAACNAAYAGIESFLAQIDPCARFAGTSPNLVTEETSCGVGLDLDFRDLLSQRFLDFISGTAHAAISHPFATATISPSRISFKISYVIKDSDIAMVGFRMADKFLTIEPRLHTSPTDRRFYTQSPTDSETHLRLLQELERAFQ